ncbi:transcriptional repressor LexA [Streptomyces sp. NPDC000594]|uniref:transcriptional repressor LexA n=1 Tax=Streptomyces sp. NPDC000594 TaxID=3154261 RepID=UPI00331D0EA7
MTTDRTAGRPGRPAGVHTGPDGLTARQADIVRLIRAYTAEHGYPPSMREIGQGVGLSSTSSVAHQLGALERKQVVGKDPHRPRAYRVLPGRAAGHGPDTGGEPGTAHVPLVGRIAAGAPLLAHEDTEDVLPLPRRLVGDGDLFALTVVGDSMTGAAICPGDVITARRQAHAEDGDIVVALLGEEATVKRLRREPGAVWLAAENPAYAPIPAEDAVILGRVVAVLRTLV